MAFNAKDDLSDLPNFEIFDIDSAKRENNELILTLRYPITSSYQEGTKVRLHRHGSTFVYLPADNRVLKGEWQNFSGKNNINSFRIGTKFIQPVAVFISKTPADIDFKNIKIEEIPEAK